MHGNENPNSIKSDFDSLIGFEHFNLMMTI